MPRVGEIRSSVSTVRPRPTAVGSYIFAGGFTLGTVQAGFDVLCHLEESNYGVATAKANMSWLPIHVGVERWPLDDLRRRGVDYVYGNPPCAAWSIAGAATKKGRTWSSSSLVDCTRRHIKTLRALRPKVWVWESVCRAWTVGRDFVDGLAVEAASLGYSTTVLLHDARYLGVPQARPRMFVVCHRVEFEPIVPQWTETDIETALSQVIDRGEPMDRNIRKVCGMIKSMRQGENLAALWMRLTPEAIRETNDRGQMKGRPAFTIKRARLGKPAPVIMHEVVHPTETRGLTARELAHLCGYPQWFKFVGLKDVRQIGRGVCPPVGEWLGRAVRLACDEGRDVSAPQFRLVDYRSPPGRSEVIPYRTFENASSTPTALPPVKTADRPPTATTTATTTAATTATTTAATIAATTAATVSSVSADSPPRRRGSGERIREMLSENRLTHQQIVEVIHREFSGSKATVSDVRWNLNRLRRQIKNEARSVERPPRTDVVPEVTAVASPVGRSSVVDGEPAADVHVPQRLRTQLRSGTDPDRKFDQTSLRSSAHGKLVHRDYGAHFFRWGFAARFVTGDTAVLDVGCGPDVMLVEVLTMPRSSVPKRYVGVDMNRRPTRCPTRQWATTHWEFDFLARHLELGQFDLVTCFEVIEHMRKTDGDRLLTAVRACLNDGGRALLSTPVFDGKAAANHIHEWTVDELDASIRAAGLRVERRFGTFASQRDIKKVASPAELDIVGRLSEYYGGEVISCFLAPLYPDASRNNVWVLRKDGA